MEPEMLAALLKSARKARDNAYAPYSRFKVGAALLTQSGKVFSGCNVENVSYGATICAERNALGAAVTAGERNFAAICISAGKEMIFPCGICRQALSEFSAGMEVYCDSEEGVKRYLLSELLPSSFSSFKPQG